jgi:hypothetical protein
MYFINPQINGANLCTTTPRMRHYGIQGDIYKLKASTLDGIRWIYYYLPSHVAPLASYFLECSLIKQNLKNCIKPFMSSKEKKERNECAPE